MAKGWEVRDQYYAFKHGATHVMIANALGGYPESVTWSMDNPLGFLDDWDFPPHKRMFVAGLVGGETTLYAAYGPNPEDVKFCKVIVFPSYEWTTLGSNLDLDSDGITDVTCISTRKMLFPYGVRLVSLYAFPDNLAAVDTSIEAPDPGTTEWELDGMRILVFNTSTGKVFAGVCSNENDVPALAYRELR